jgi:phosphate transport system protein
LNPPSHLEESLQRAMDVIRGKVAEMATLGERALQASLQAFVERNRQLAYSVILRDQYLDELETEVDRLCLEFLVRQQPAAGHLRFVFTAIKVNKELERIGDYAESIARQALSLGTPELPLPYPEFVELANLAAHTLHDAVEAFLGQDAELARRTALIEERANTVRNEINAELLGLHQAGRLPAEALAPLMTIARRFERVTDQAKNICEEVLYLCTGEFIKHPGAEAFRILFVDADNRCLSQMAEGIGNAMGLARFVFSSAGIAPVPVDSQVVEFMTKKGIDVSRQTSKTREQVPHWEHYQVMIALGEEGRKTFPNPPTKTICLTWPAQDPTAVEGGGAAVLAAFESTYRFLEEQIRDLVEAIRGEPNQPRSS